MTIETPTPDQLSKLASEIGLDLTDDDTDAFLGLMAGSIGALNTVDAMPDELPPVRYPRDPAYTPTAEENPLNGWYVKTAIKGASTGPLAGKTVAFKDNIMVANVPMMCGSETLEGYVPEIDATWHARDQNTHPFIQIQSVISPRRR